MIGFILFILLRGSARHALTAAGVVVEVFAIGAGFAVVASIMVLTSRSIQRRRAAGGACTVCPFRCQHELPQPRRGRALPVIGGRGLIARYDLDAKDKPQPGSAPLIAVETVRVRDHAMPAADPVPAPGTRPAQAAWPAPATRPAKPTQPAGLPVWPQVLLPRWPGVPVRASESPSAQSPSPEELSPEALPAQQLAAQQLAAQQLAAQQLAAEELPAEELVPAGDGPGRLAG